MCIYWKRAGIVDRADTREWAVSSLLHIWLYWWYRLFHIIVLCPAIQLATCGYILNQTCASMGTIFGLSDPHLIPYQELRIDEKFDRKMRLFSSSKNLLNLLKFVDKWSNALQMAQQISPYTKTQPYKVATPERFICTVLKINHGHLVVTFDCNSAKTQYFYHCVSHELRNTNKIQDLTVWAFHICLLGGHWIQ